MKKLKLKEVARKPSHNGKKPAQARSEMKKSSSHKSKLPENVWYDDRDGLD